jgi:hypothetical protein
VNPTILRAVVITIGSGLAAYYFWTLYGQSVHTSSASRPNPLSHHPLNYTARHRSITPGWR